MRRHHSRRHDSALVLVKIQIERSISMNDIYNGLTVFLISESLPDYIELGIMTILFGFAFCSLLSIFAYGINQVKSLFNI